MILDYSLGGFVPPRCSSTSSTRCFGPSGSEEGTRHDRQRLDPDRVYLRDRRRAREAARLVHDPRLQRRAHVPVAAPAAGRGRALPARRGRREREQHWLDLCGRHAALQRRRASSSSTCCSACRRAALQPGRAWRRSRRTSPSTPAISFVTNTNWQNYGGESTMSYLVADGRPDRAEFRVGGDRHRARGRADPRLRPRLGATRSAISGSI